MAENRELTLTDKKKLEEELEELTEAKKRVAEEIKVARGFGDLSENAEYDAAKKEEARVYVSPLLRFTSAGTRSVAAMMASTCWNA